MSCNGCRVLRKGCSDSCVLRPCLQWIESPEAQGHATVFVAKFFGRAGLMSFISAVPDSHRPACGRTINPVNGAVGLLWTGNWHLCQEAVETVLRGGIIRPLPELTGSENSDASAERPGWWPSFSATKRRKAVGPVAGDHSSPFCDLQLCLNPRSPTEKENQRSGTPSMNSEESVTTSADSCFDCRPMLLNLFN
ncbi:hypothetical protein HPP92_024637 [Vanilla planifolia]|uniref:LOB domain-containing protein n=1 Tax=Vanilla planifolia TaxID=51239 RepID=A0A835UBI3_VANPL|nr:hypothetical protein HPP92_024637 [Vanilla planifolia]